MKTLTRIAFLFTLLGGLAINVPASLGAETAKSQSVDVAIYGATPAGIMAARAAAEEGTSVLLIEPGKHVGGMAASGLGDTDVGNPNTIGGMSAEFYRRIAAKYASDGTAKSGFRFEPHVAEQLFQEMLAEQKVPVLFEKSLQSVTKEGPSIRSIQLSDGSTVEAKTFVDASYEGDLMAKAGIDYRTGRESQAEFGETLAGVQPIGKLDEKGAPPHGIHQGPGHSSLKIPTMEFYRNRRGYLNTHQFAYPVSGLDAKGNLLPLVTGREAGSPYSGDEKFMAYNYRLCFTDRPENRIPIEKPANYDPNEYELFARYIAGWPDIRLGQLFHIARMPNGKSDFNSSGPLSTDFVGEAWDYPEATPEQRLKIANRHRDLLQGLFYFLAHDERVPTSLQREMQQWGLCKDEFADNDYWPWQLYVRVCRRMRGEFVLTQRDVLVDTHKPESMGMGSFVIDSHNVQRVLRADGSVINEGGIEVPTRPYGIPYGSLVPKKSECDNLLVPVCCSASYIAYCTLRMEPVYMALGQSSGVAAAMAAREGKPVQEIDRAELRGKLLRAHQVLDLPSNRVLKADELKGTVIDNTNATFTGKWGSSRGYGTYVGDDYRVDLEDQKGPKTARYEAQLPAGRYEVRMTVAAYTNRARNVPVTITDAQGDHAVVVNQRQAGPNNDPFVSLGTYTFKEGQPAVVTISNKGIHGHVVADAVQFLPRD